MPIFAFYFLLLHFKTTVSTDCLTAGYLAKKLSMTRKHFNKDFKHVKGSGDKIMTFADRRVIQVSHCSQ